MANANQSAHRSDKVTSRESGHVLDWLSESNLIFKLSAFKEPLQQWLSQTPCPVQPPERAAQV